MTNFKELSEDDKINYLKTYLQAGPEEIVDDTVAFNVFLLLCPPLNFKSDFFAHEKVIFSSLVEFITLAKKLQEELGVFASELLGVYESCFKHCVSVTVDKKEVHVPEKYLKVLMLLDFQKIDKLYSKYTSINNNEKYTDSYKVIYSFLGQFNFYMNVMSEGGFGDASSTV